MWEYEEMGLYIIGKVIIIVGFGGAIFTLFFDHIARGLPETYDWLQILGIVGFATLASFGIWADKFICNNIIPIVKEKLSD